MVTKKRSGSERVQPDSGSYLAIERARQGLFVPLEGHVYRRGAAHGRRAARRRAQGHPADLGAAVLDALVKSSRSIPAVEDVIVGCVSQVGEQSFHIGRNMVMASRLPDSVPAVSIDRQCGSSQQALHFAAQAVMSGTQDVVIAAGVESMTRVPMGTPVILPMQAGIGIGPWPRSIKDRYGVDQFSQFTGAEMMAGIYGFTREELDPFALPATARPPRRTAGAFDREIVRRWCSTRRAMRACHDRDEGIRVDASLEGASRAQDLSPTGSSPPAMPARLRRRLGRAGGIGTGAEAPWPEAAGADRQSDRHRRRPGDHADGADPGDRRAWSGRAASSTRSTSTRSTRPSRRSR